MTKQHIERFENVKYLQDKAFQAYKDGYIFDDEELFMKWLSLLTEINYEINELRHLVGMEYLTQNIER